VLACKRSPKHMRRTTAGVMRLVFSRVSKVATYSAKKYLWTPLLEHRAAHHSVVAVTGTTPVGGNALAPTQPSVGTAAVRADKPLHVQVAFEPHQALFIVQQIGDGKSIIGAPPPAGGCSHQSTMHASAS
jgi:hypothetical protein